MPGKVHCTTQYMHPCLKQGGKHISTSDFMVSSHLKAAPNSPNPRIAARIDLSGAVYGDVTPMTYSSVTVLSCQNSEAGGVKDERFSRVPSAESLVTSSEPFDPPMPMLNVSPVSGSIVGCAL